MKISIKVKLLLGFLVVIAFNAAYFKVVTNLTKLNAMTTILSRENAIKNSLLEARNLQKGRERSHIVFLNLGSKDAAKTFFDNSSRIVTLLNSINSTLNDFIVDTSRNLVDKSSTGRIISYLNDSLVTLNKQYTGVFSSVYDKITMNSSLFDSRTVIAGINDSMLRMDKLFIRELSSLDSISEKMSSKQISMINERIGFTKNTSILIFISVGIFSVLFAFFFSNYITDSLRRFKAKVDIIAGGNFDIEPDKFANDEIGDLALAFFDMAHDLKKAQDELIEKRRFAAIGEIVASVNHEINNPLMIISGNAQFLDMTIDEEKNSAETKERIKTIIEESDRISVVTKKLREIKNPVVEDYTTGGEKMINLDKSSEGFDV